ncbi:MAG TPA: hypothetical protein DDW25_10570 [Ktedonobacter sp.]|jgi:hypothetical protein|nr:hypothetical protein [Ktedonobacter sp.]
MSNSETHIQETQHAFLVAWGWFAEHIGLIQQLQALSFKQKHYHHRPQTKVLEFLVAILAGLQHLQDISLAAHPLDKDQAVAHAWEQPAWADYSGVSRTLSGLSWDEVKQIVQALEQVSQPYLTTELTVLCSQGKRVRLDGDLTGIPVSNTSQTYPNAAFGHMDDEIRLGYQAGVVSLESPTYGRLWLSVAHHPGDTVSCTQAEALVLAAEARLQRRPRRRTELLRQRIHACEQQVAQTGERLEMQKQAVKRAKERTASAEQQVQERQQQVDDLEKEYQTRKLQERPTSRLAQAHKRLQAVLKRLSSRKSACTQAQRRLDKTTAQRSHQQTELAHLYQRLLRFEQENAANAEPIEAEFRLDAGFGTYENVALLIEMGYEVYTKPHSHKIVTYLKGQVDDTTVWTPVGANAELVAWPTLQLKNCSYPLDVALERFYTGKTLKQSALFHFGTHPVTENLPGWFEEYNGRQTIEAGIKESKQVFYLHHLKVRSEPAISLQEAFVLFAANFIRWASHWLQAQGQPVENALNVQKLGVKRQVHVAAHVSAQVIQDSGGKWLKFSEQSAFAGQVLRVVGDQPSPQKANF